MRECAVCHHPLRNDIDSALIGKGPRLHYIVDQFGITKTSLIRHRNSCLSKNLLQPKAVSNAQDASALVRELQQIAKFTSKLLSRAVKEQDFDLAAKVVERLEAQLALKASYLEKPKDTQSKADEETSKLHALSGRSSAPAWVREQARA